MISRIRNWMIASLVVFCLSLSLGFASEEFECPPEEEAPPADVFSAGNKSGPGGAICTCPVLVGDCVCHVKAQ